MLTFERTQDFELVKQIITHPAIYEHMHSDGAPAPENFQVSEAGWYFLVRDQGELLGLFICVPQTSVCWEIHTCLLPAARGKRAFRAYREGLAYLKAHTSCRKVIGNIPADNPGALAIALRSGCRAIGVNTKSISHGGRLLDQVIVGKEL